MFPPSLLIALLILCATPTAPPPPAAAPTSALSQLSPEARGKAARRAKFVYRLPDGTVWDSWQYCEFRDVLREFDALPKDAQPSPRLRAWGYKAGQRRIGPDDSRPHPLWHSPSDARNKGPTFIYINTAHASAADKDREPMVKIGKEIEPRLFKVSVREYPKNDVTGLPFSFGIFGSAEPLVQIPAELGARTGQSLSGEFFFITDPDIKKPEGEASLFAPCRLHHAAKLRLNPEQYAAALLVGEIEMIEWSFRRTTDRLGEKFEWTRRVVEAKASANSDNTGAPEPPAPAEPPR